MMTPELPSPDDSALDEMLVPSTFSSSHELRARLFRRTSRRLRWRWRIRKTVPLFLLFAFFLGGMLAMSLIRSATPRDTLVRTVPQKMEHQSPPRSDGMSEQEVSPAQLELEAERSFVKSEAARRFRDAGNRYLREQANFKAALRCYQNFLDEAAEDDMNLSDSDTWLLISLKNARRKETQNVDD